MATIHPAILLLGAAAGGFLTGGVSIWSHQPSPPALDTATGTSAGAMHQHMVAQCYAVDGDTLRCGAERIRLIGIDSPELPGHCRPGRHCVEGDPYAAKAALSGAVSGQMRIRRFGTDHYGRTLALVTGPLGDLSCTQWRAGHAIYRADWDVDGQMMRGCATGRSRHIAPASQTG